ncbi:MAG: putative O-glycosylation ligase, exosortase A system-associated [Methylomarinum sp.]|nr:putative O-glycosylation ligase, exosortase A system-associated [Methylomarinum sp.]
MRDIVVTLFVFAGLLYTIKKPYVGILVWSWLGYMNPHRLCYGFAYSMPFSQITALLTMGALLFSKERKVLPKDILVYLLLFFILWMGLTTLFAFEAEAAKEQYIKILKIQLPVFLTMMMFTSKERIHQLLWVIVVSLGYFSTKGGIFTLMTGGAFRVYGPPGSFVEENNALAIASLMVIPLLVYLRTTLTRKWAKQVALFAIISMSFSVIGSQSRGAFLAILVVGTYFWLQSKHKLTTGVMIIVFIGLLSLMLPDSWYERMNSISTYDEDGSAMGRIHAWTLAYNVANQNLLGGGLNLWTKITYTNYLEGFDPLRQTAFVAHSIYLSILGEHGWFGLFLYLLIYAIGWSYCKSLVKQCDGQAHIQWIADLARMMKVGLLAYFAGGAFLSLSYFDLPWHYLAIIVLLKEIAKNSEAPEIIEANKIVEESSTKIIINEQGIVQ